MLGEHKQTGSETKVPNRKWGQGTQNAMPHTVGHSKFTKRLNGRCSFFDKTYGRSRDCKHLICKILEVLNFLTENRWVLSYSCPHFLLGTLLSIRHFKRNNRTASQSSIQQNKQQKE
uniref:(northern house mosquito) hypothetical protein n=1 Tax=Culex pipiens TaxID=7175 RepID=A0A8D8C2S7_CULPI